MKGMYASLISAICAIIVGVLVLNYPGETLLWLVIVMGVMFLIPGLVTIISYLRLRSAKSNDANPIFPYSGCGSVLFGLVLILRPSFFVLYTQYVLAVLLILAGVNIWAYLLTFRKLARVGFMHYLFATLIILAGAFIFLNPFESAAIPMYVLGVGNIFFGIVEIYHLIKYRKCFMPENAIVEKTAEIMVIDDHAEETDAINETREEI